MSLTTIATVAMGVAGGKSAEALKPAYGLSYRFTMEIDSIKTGWQTCAGLKVDFKPVEVKAGGGYASTRYLPGEVSYPRVILKRAICEDDAKALQTWLAKKAHGWVNTKDQDKAAGSTATITLHDSYGKAVMKWKLRNARPAAWSGPDLDANASKVALETLELVHEGFEVEAGGSTQPSANAPTQDLTIKGTGGSVKFLYPPTEIQLQRSQQHSHTLRPQSVTGVPATTPVSDTDVTDNPPNTTTFTLNNLLIVGQATMASIQLLTEWATREPQQPGAASDVLPVIELNWGKGFAGLKVTVRSLNVSYTRFTPDGTPIQAKVGLTLQPAGNAETKQTNPTSGGIPGRSAHVLRATDSLGGLANSNYGRPDRWRAIAVANGMDDPLRIRPGSVCYLPALSELETLT